MTEETQVMLRNHILDVSFFTKNILRRGLPSNYITSLVCLQEVQINKTLNDMLGMLSMRIDKLARLFRYHLSQDCVF